MSPPGRTVTVHSQPGCHLCDEAIETLMGMLPEYPGMEVVIADINQSDEMLRLYLERIPVVEVDGRIVSELVLEEDEVRRHLDTPESFGPDTLTGP